MIKRRSLSLFVLLILSSCWLEAATYYINSNGNDSNSGTSVNQAWASISRVNRMIFSAGDVILFEGGSTFQGSISFSPFNRGTAEQPIVVGSYGNGRATISSGTSSGLSAYNTAGFHIKDLIFKGSGRQSNTGSGIEFYMDLSNRHLNYINIDKVDVSGYRQAGIMVGSWNGASGFSNISITNSVAHNNGEAGIGTFAEAVLGHKNIYIGNCKAYNNSGLPEKTDSHSGSGIVLGGVDGGVIEYSEAYNNGWLNAWRDGGPVGIWAYQCNNITIQHNESHHNRTGTTKDGGGFDVDGGCTNTILQYNYSHDNEGAGYLVAQFNNAPPMNNITIRYNISENDGRKNGYGAIHLWSSGANGGIRNLDIYNNSVYLSPASGGQAPRAFFAQSGGIHSTRVMNNIFQTTAGLPLVQAQQGSGLSFEGNNYWASGKETKFIWGSTTYTSLAAWQQASGQEKRNGNSRGTVLDPEFENPGTGIHIGDQKRLNTLSGYKLKESTALAGHAMDRSEYYGIEVGKIDFWGNSLGQEEKLVPGAYKAAINIQPDEDIEEAIEDEFIVEEGSGLSYSYYEGKWSQLPDFSRLEPKKQGTISGFSLEPRDRQDFFAFVYEGYITVPTAGTYTFYANSDDGSQLFINGKMVVDNDGGHSARERSGSVYLSAGKHPIKVSYFEGWGDNVLEVSYQGPGIEKQIIPASVLSSSQSSSSPSLTSVPQVESGLSYSYYEGKWSQLPDFSGLEPKKQGTIGGFSLEPRLRQDFFAFVYEGYIRISASGTYTFYVNSDDGSQLFINGKMIVDNDGGHSARERSGSVYLSAGDHPIKVSYFEGWGDNVLEVSYQGPGIAKQAIPGEKLYSKKALSQDGGNIAAARFDNEGAISLSSKGTVNYILYPNPVERELNIKFDNVPDTEVIYAIYNINGALILTGELNVKNFQGTEIVDLQTLKAGFYIIKLTEGNKVLENKSFIKIK